MKRFIIIFSILALFAGILSCDSSSDPAVPEVTKLTVNVTYTGPLETADTTLGRLYLYLIEDGTVLDNTPPVYATPSSLSVKTSDKITLNQSYSFTIEDIPAGDYQVMIFYDYLKQTTREAGKTDKYVLYDSTNATNHTVQYLEDATTITINDGDTINLPDISFSDTYQLGPTDAQFQIKPVK